MIRLRRVAVQKLANAAQTFGSAGRTCLDALRRTYRLAVMVFVLVGLRSLIAKRAIRRWFA
jgi:hypothetical protein